MHVKIVPGGALDALHQDPLLNFFYRYKGEHSGVILRLASRQAITLHNMAAHLLRGFLLWSNICSVCCSARSGQINRKKSRWYGVVLSEGRARRDVM